MAITQTDIDRLEEALTSGVLTVEYDGKRTTFAAVKDLKLAIAYAKEQLAASTATGVVSQSFVSFSKD